MKNQINSSKEGLINIDENRPYFEKNIWDHENITKYQKEIIEIYKVILETMTDKLSFSKVDTSFLIRENTYLSISVFIDAILRIKTVNNIDTNKIKKNKQQKNLRLVDRFFLENSISIDKLLDSKVFRYKLINLLFKIFNTDYKNRKYYSENKKINVEELNLPKAKYFHFKRKIYKFLNKFDKNVVLSLSNLLMQNFRLCLIKVGYFNLPRKYFFQFRDIRFKKINIKKLDLNITKKNKLDFFDSIKIDFKNRIKDSIESKKLLVLNTLNEELINVLLYLIVFSLEDLLFDKKKLNHTIDTYASFIKAQNLKAIFNQGGMNRFENVLPSIAAKNLKIPIIEFQNGGATIFDRGYPFDYSKNIVNSYDYIENNFIWGDFSRIKNNKHFIKCPNIELKNVKGNNKKNIKTILFSIAGLSNIYECEIKNSLTGSKLFDHSKKVNDIIESVIETGYFDKIYIKIKGHDSNLFDSYEYFLVPFLDNNNKPKSNNVFYITEGLSEDYYNLIDIHFCDSLSTSFIKSMSKNLPTIIYMNSEIYKIKQEYIHLFKKLRETGIIIEDKNDIKKSLNNIISKNIWKEDKIQSVRNEFLNKFCYTEDRGIKNFNDLLVNYIYNFLEKENYK